MASAALRTARALRSGLLLGRLLLLFEAAGDGCDFRDAFRDVFKRLVKVLDRAFQIKVRLDFRKVARHVVGQMTEDTEQGAVDAVVRAVLETFPAVDHFGEAEGERNDGGHAVGAPHGTAAVVLDLVDDRIDGAAARKRRVDGAVAAVDEFLQTVLFVGIRQSGDLEFQLADIYTDAVTLKKVSEDVNRLLARDENLEEEENRELRKRLDRFMEEKYEKLNL